MHPVSFITGELPETYRVLFQKNTFEKLVHLVGFVIRTCHDALSHERHIHAKVSNYFCGQCQTTLEPSA